MNFRTLKTTLDYFISLGYYQKKDLTVHYRTHTGRVHNQIGSITKIKIILKKIKPFFSFLKIFTK